MVTFSVVVPAFNAAATLSETLDAIQSQVLGDWECVVVDDGSTDATAALARLFVVGDPRFRLIGQANLGSAGAYNSGVSAATGRYVVLCSADDILLPDHLSSMARFIDEHPGFDIYSSNGYYLMPDGSREPVYLDSEMPDSLTFADVARNCFYSVGASYRRELFDAIGGYRVGVFGEDYDFWLRAMAAGARHRYVPSLLSLHRVSPSQKSANVEAAYRSDIELLTNLLDVPTLTDEDRTAIARGIRDRERLILQARDGSQVARIRGAGVDAGVRMLGKARLRRLLGRLRRLLPRKSASGE